MAAVWLGLGLWLMAATFYEWADRVKLFKVNAMKRIRRQPRASVGMSFGHLGLAIAVMGMAGASDGGTEQYKIMAYGDAISIGGYELICSHTNVIYRPS